MTGFVKVMRQKLDNNCGYVLFLRRQRALSADNNMLAVNYSTDNGNRTVALGAAAQRFQGGPL
ncbi:MAG TPA: hypothetical protein VMW23_03465 [Sedimentisphaerales bacterium]|nr:hypothetical protein [Sedimentisphaerales bacterium]